MFSRELPAAQGRVTHLGVLRLPPPARKKAHAPGAWLRPSRLAWTRAALRTSRGDIFGKRVATMWDLDEANKNRYYRIGSSCFWPSPAAQAAGKTFSSTKSLKTSKFSPSKRDNQSVLPINQRVNLAIGASEKMERDSRSK
jgi:hypothetical protein